MEKPNLEETNFSDSAAIQRPHVLDIGPDKPVENTTAPELSVTASRREFLIGAASVGASLTLAPALLEGEAGAQMPVPAGKGMAMPVPPVNITLSINGTDHPLTVEPRVTLLDALRERIHLTGTKKGCDHGQCGACTVHIDGRRVNSCLTFAIMHQGQKITTIEGLAEGDNLHPMQTAFIAHDGFQCGYCTPGQIMSAVAVVNEGHAKTEADIKEQMSGNLCRCGAYPNIVAAIQSVMNAKTNDNAGKPTAANAGSGAFHAELVSAGDGNASRSEGGR